MKRLSISVAAAMMAAAMMFPANASATLQRAFKGNVVERSAQSETAKTEAQPMKEFLNSRTPKGTSLEPMVGSMLLDAPQANEGPALLNVKQNPKRVIKRTADDPVGEIYGVFPTFVGAYSNADAVYAKINPVTGTWEIIYRDPVFQISQTDYYYQSGAVRENILYIPNYYENPATGEIRIFWTRVDLETGERLADINFASNTAAFFYSMVYDDKNDCFWGLSIDFGGQTGGNLVRVDCAGNPKYWDTYNTGINLGPTEGEFANSIVYNPIDQRVYAIRDNGILVSIDPKKEQKASIVCEFDRAEAPFCFNTMYMASPLVYSPRDKAFIGMHIDSDNECMVMYGIDAETYDAYELGTLNPTGYLASLYCTDDYAKDDAPDRVDNLKVNLVENNLNGSFEFQMPRTTFGGIALPASTPIDVKVKLNDNVIWTGKELPGANVKVNYTFPHGLHKLCVESQINNDLVGPEVRLRFYAGDDNPFEPQDVYLEGYKLTWGEPRYGGVHDGYVDNTKMTYNVYWDGTKKLNSEPLTVREFTIPEPAQQERHTVTVTTVVNGMESDHSEGYSRVFGPAFTLPVSFTPTAKEADLFDIIDANGDGKDNKFNIFYYNAAEKCFTYRDEFNFYQANDYLFFPRINFADGESQYSVSFTYGGYFKADDLPNTFELYLAKSVNANPRQMTLIDDTHANINVATPRTITVRFSVPEPGDYYLVLRELGPDQKYRGANISNFKVQALEGYTTKAPGDPTNVTVVTDPTGKMEAVVSFTAPTVDMKGNPLSSSEQITITAKSNSASGNISLLPGAKGEIRVPTDIEGKQEIEVTPSNSEGEGVSRPYYAYIGLDTPTAPQNVQGKTLDNNLGMTLTWEAPSSVGENGGYVDTNNLSYRIYNKYSINYTQIAEVFNEFTYTHTISPMKQESFYLGPMAANAKGQNKTSMFIGDILGTPYPLPMSEEFNNTKFNTQRWTQEVNGEYLPTYWETATNLSTLSIGNPVPNGGGMLYSYNTTEGSAYGRMNSPKFSTTGVKKASVNIRYWSCPKSTNMELYLRSNKDQTYKKVEELNGRQIVGAQWKDWKAFIPAEYLDCEWVQAAVRVYHRTGDTYTVIDSFSVISEVEYDFAIGSITGPYSAIVGESPEFEIEVINGGLEAARPDLIVELVADDNVVLQKKEFQLGRIPSSGNMTQRVNFEIGAESMKYDQLTVRASVNYPDDEIGHNNSGSATFIIKQSVLPVVTDLKGEWADKTNNKGVNLTWSEPSTEWGPNEDFEAIPPFQITDRIGQWKNVDMDKKDPFYLNGLEWENCRVPSGWMVINADEVGFTDERSLAKSGKQYILARSIGYNGDANEDPIPAVDWLISPEVKGGSTVNFWMSTLDYQYTETITIFYSTTDDQLGDELEVDETDPKNKVYSCGSFKSLRHFTKSGSDAWEECSFTLPEDAKYFAFVYRSIGNLGCMIDDIQFEPVNNQSWDIESYDVVRVMDGTEQIIGNVHTPSFVDNDINDSNASYYVQTVVYSEGKPYVSPKSNVVNVYSTSVEGVFGENTFVGGGKNIILFGGLSGKNAKIYATDGRLVRDLTLASDRETVSIDAGIYLVKIGKESVKVLVK